MLIIIFAVYLRNRLISAVLEPVLNHTKKSCLTSYNKQFSKNNKKKNDTIFVGPGLQPIGANKTGFNLIIVPLNIHGKMSIIRLLCYLCQQRGLCLSSGSGLYRSITPTMELVMTPLPGGGEEIRVSPLFTSLQLTVGSHCTLNIDCQCQSRTGGAFTQSTLLSTGNYFIKD